MAVKRIKAVSVAIDRGQVVVVDVDGESIEATVVPVPMILHCPMCHARHLDEGDFATKHHHTHACQSCGHCWRPAIAPTVGVQFLPGFKN